MTSACFPDHLKLQQITKSTYSLRNSEAASLVQRLLFKTYENVNFLVYKSRKLSVCSVSAERNHEETTYVLVFS